MRRMGILSCTWEAEWNGRTFTIRRDELTKGFSVEHEGKVLAKKSWSLAGVGTLEASFDAEGRAVPLIVELPLSLSDACKVTIDGAAVPVRQLK